MVKLTIFRATGAWLVKLLRLTSSFDKTSRNSFIQSEVKTCHSWFVRALPGVARVHLSSDRLFWSASSVVTGSVKLITMKPVMLLTSTVLFDLNEVLGGWKSWRRTFLSVLGAPFPPITLNRHLKLLYQKSTSSRPSQKRSPQMRRFSGRLRESNHRGPFTEEVLTHLHYLQENSSPTPCRGSSSHFKWSLTGGEK